MIGRLISVCLLGFGVASTALALEHKGYDMPAYQVKTSEGPIEIRHYPGWVYAETQVSGSRREAVNSGFRTLAGYIFGGNVRDEKIAMTVPVSQSRSEQGWAVQFALPTNSEITTLPTPDASEVTLREAAATEYVVISFSGRWSDENLDKHLGRLTTYADRNGLRTSGEPVYHFYDTPWSLPWTRRNEIALALR